MDIEEEGRNQQKEKEMERGEEADEGRDLWCMQNNPCQNWYDRGVLLPVGHQATSGCCWSFVTVYSVAALYIITNNTKKPPALSVQDLINSIEPPTISDYESETDRKEEKERPDTGYFAYTIDCALYHIKYIGVRYNRYVEFTGIRVPTSPPTEPNTFIKIKDYVTLPTNEVSLIAALQYHPIPVGLTMTTTSMNHFEKHFKTKDIFRPKSTRKNDSIVGHALVLVGFCTIGNENCWIVMNSWGREFGSNGFVPILRESSIRKECIQRIHDAYCPII